MENLRYEKNGVVGIITISRPKALNALNTATLRELEGLLETIERENNVNCVIVTGEGSRAFVAGADMAEMADMDEAAALEFGRYGNKVFESLENLSVPTIAVVNGYALGGGCELALSCDIIIASSNAVFATPETTLGIICGFGGTQRLARRTGPGNAKRMIFTGDRVGSEEALKIGLCDSVTCPEILMEEGLKLAGRIADSKKAVSNAKKAVNFGLDGELKAGFERESQLFAECFSSGEAKTKMKAMLERKK